MEDRVTRGEAGSWLRGEGVDVEPPVFRTKEAHKVTGRECWLE